MTTADPTTYDDRPGEWHAPHDDRADHDAAERNDQRRQALVESLDELAADWREAYNRYVECGEGTQAAIDTAWTAYAAACAEHGICEQIDCHAPGIPTCPAHTADLNRD